MSPSRIIGAGWHRNVNGIGERRVRTTTVRPGIVFDEITGIAFGWIGFTTALATVVRKP
jgi:hypothetical protein